MHRFIFNSLFWVGALLGLVFFAGCTGLTGGSNEPGESTNLLTGSIAVDNRTETVFVISCGRTGKAGCLGVGSKDVVAIDPDTAAVKATIDASNLTEVRVAFPDNEVYLIGQQQGDEIIKVLDPDTLAQSTFVRVDNLPPSSTLAPSRQWLLFGSAFEFDLFDTATLLNHKVVSGPGSRIDGTWANTEDRVFIASEADEAGTPTVTVRSWNVGDLKSADFSVSGDAWASPDIEAKIPNAHIAQLGPARSLAVASDDAHVAIALHGTDGTDSIAVLDTATATVQTIPNASGRPGFTPDGSTVVAYRTPAGGGNRNLLLADASTLAENLMPLPWPDAPSFFVTGDGHYVVVASAVGGENLVLVDLTMDSSMTLGDPRVALNEFVARPSAAELWVVDDGLSRLDMMAPSISQVTLPFTPAHINYLPTRDRLVMDDANGSTIHFVDPATETVTDDTPLPAP